MTAVARNTKERMKDGAERHPVDQMLPVGQLAGAERVGRQCVAEPGGGTLTEPAVVALPDVADGEPSPPSWDRDRVVGVAMRRLCMRHARAESVERGEHGDRQEAAEWWQWTE